MALCAESGMKCKGIDISSVALKTASGLGFEVNCINVDEEEIPVDSQSVDGVFCCEVIEHVYDTDHLLSECSRILKPGGTMIVTTPNLASWNNRLLLVFGYQPLNTEVSLRHTVGHPLRSQNPGGHIHCFTKKALVELVSFHPSLQIVRFIRIGTSPMAADYPTKFRVAAKIGNTLFRTSSLSSDLFVVLKKRH